MYTGPERFGDKGLRRRAISLSEAGIDRILGRVVMDISYSDFFGLRLGEIEKPKAIPGRGGSRKYMDEWLILALDEDRFRVEGNIRRTYMTTLQGASLERYGSDFEFSNLKHLVVNAGLGYEEEIGDFWVFSPNGRLYVPKEVYV
tara:strand:+ start:14873 stop:15307 length:435 start_codon:yes stop_codon:yes gene_type:complete